jgi:hypothetical protein
LGFHFTNLGPTALAFAEPNKKIVNYSKFWNAIGQDVSSGDDAIVFNGLPTGPSFAPYMNRTTEAGGKNHELPYVDDDGGLNNSLVNLTSANAKALGLLSAHDAALDAIITYNNSYVWDMDPDDGISTFDFYGVTMHEIGHALGFISGVDYVDHVAAGYGPGGVLLNGEPVYGDDEDLPFVTSLDFLRHSDDSVADGADFDFTVDARNKFFSLDGEDGGGSHWSTGQFHGDGEQASHWKDGLALGVMGPRASEGQQHQISDFDLVAFDAIGYDRGGIASIPEPSGLLVGLLALIPAFRRKRNRQRCTGLRKQEFAN